MFRKLRFQMIDDILRRSLHKILKEVSTIAECHTISLTMTSMATGCACRSYKHLELLRDDVTNRIRKTNKLRQNLQPIEGAERHGDALYQCVSAGNSGRRVWRGLGY